MELAFSVNSIFMKAIHIWTYFGAGYFGITSLAGGASFSGVNITFNEPAFPTADNTSMTGGQSFNVLNDSTGGKIATSTELGQLVGDNADLLMNFQSSSGNLGSTSLQWQAASAGRFTANHSFAGTVPGNNPGSLNSNTITLAFGGHMSVTDFSMRGLSFNTSGIAWEYTVVEFFRPDGSSFTTAPTIGNYASHTSIGGSPSQGWFVMDSKGTVTGVGTSQTVSGVSGPNDNIGIAGLGYADVGLAAGTTIGGIRITTYLEDVRGTTNTNTNFTSSFTEFTISGSIVPEPSSALLAAGGLGLAMLRRRAR